MTGATVSLRDFAALFAHDPGKKRPKTPKAMNDAFRAGTSPAERAVWAEIQQWNQTEAAILEQELFANRKRLADAARSLQAKGGAPPFSRTLMRRPIQAIRSVHVKA